MKDLRLTIQDLASYEAALPLLHSTQLFAQGREIRIEHAGEQYRLRLTRNNRLILTK